ncbi:MAG: hypothetical protein A4E32_00763 [Methanomassiliicoccales archaeon PtaU1.Bin124]|nr:MAG: hypothetical protein A4E32_00763 [Methanomassiliicoccales archaeon PtaU1.Bin124]
MHIDLKGLLVPTKDSRHGSWLAAIIAIIATRSVIMAWVGGPSNETLALTVVTAVLTATYALFRIIELFNSPGFRVRYLVRSVNVVFMTLILLGQFVLNDFLGRTLLLIALVAIEFNLVSMYLEYTGKGRRAAARIWTKKK